MNKKGNTIRKIPIIKSRLTWTIKEKNGIKSYAEFVRRFIKEVPGYSNSKDNMDYCYKHAEGEGNGYMPDILDAMAEYLNVSPRYLTGEISISKQVVIQKYGSEYADRLLYDDSNTWIPSYSLYEDRIYSGTSLHLLLKYIESLEIRLHFNNGRIQDFDINDSFLNREMFNEILRTAIEKTICKTVKDTLSQKELNSLIDITF